MFCMAVLDGICQTKFKNISIECEESYKIEMQVQDVINSHWVWLDIDCKYIFLEYEYGWYYNGEINFKLAKNDSIEFRLTRFTEEPTIEEEYSSVTYFTLYGGDTRTVVDGGSLLANGEHQYFGR